MMLGHLSSFIIPRALAAQSPSPGAEIPSFFSVTCASSTGFLCVLEKVLGLLLTIATPIVAIMVVIGGLQIMLGGSSPEKITSGKKTILYAVIGFAVILLASSVVPILTSLFQ
jgi:Type IV secretion system pilin